jgi:hypothetical protein
MSCRGQASLLMGSYALQLLEGPGVTEGVGLCRCVQDYQDAQTAYQTTIKNNAKRQIRVIKPDVSEGRYAGEVSSPFSWASGRAGLMGLLPL